MKIYQQAPADVTRYIDLHRDIALEDEVQHFENYLRPIRRFKEITPDTEILEIGTGTGWFPLLCKLRGLKCKGLEISSHLIEIAKQTGRRYGIEPDIELGNLEDYGLPDDFYDVVIASSVFEHVEDWRTGVHKVYRTLKAGGVLYFESTNKFSFTSGEYSGIPLYGWMPNAWRYAIRKKVQGEDIMKLGIDFHQFTHACLRSEFKRAGFTRILDRVDVAENEHITTGFRRRVVRLAKRFGPARALALTFAEATRFICIK
ncbi:MAG: class I SAM-dependent methyltransferase [Acidobacteriaceae bacterium]|nr:class I SAM-dependent methyltransferase [Acidobacteriaceae bacterium]MBV9297028.1 class I SAM-dependent methyltransferase [Acidobacteriaceae bacterium]MBV9763722.1 class I SAM-dependent methyltransferase [Acidobacteriaceae bacterium]